MFLYLAQSVSGEVVSYQFYFGMVGPFYFSRFFFVFRLVFLLFFVFLFFFCCFGFFFLFPIFIV